MKALVLCLCCLWADMVHAQPMMLTFFYDGPRTDRFHIALGAPGGGTEHLMTAPSAPGACDPGPDAPPALLCTYLPTCLSTGTWTVRVIAVGDDGESPPSEPLTCTIAPGTPCACAETVVTLPPLPRVPVPQAPVPLPSIPPEVQGLLNPMPATAPGQALAGPALLQQALDVKAPSLPTPAPT